MGVIMKKTCLSVIISVFVSLLVSVNCFCGMFSVDIRTIVQTEQKAFAVSSNKVAQCAVITKALKDFTIRVQQEPAMMKLTRSTSVKWDWNEKFFTPISKDFAKICATGFAKTETALLAALRTVVQEAHVLRDLFVNAAQASDEAKDAVQSWFNKMVDVTGLEVKKPTKAGFFDVPSDDTEDSEDEDDKDGEDGIDIDDFKDIEKILRKLSKKLHNVKKTFKKLKASKATKEKEAEIIEIQKKLQDIEALTDFIESMVNVDKAFDEKLLRKLKQIHENLEIKLKECQAKIDEFLNGKSPDEEEAE